MEKEAPFLPTIKQQTPAGTGQNDAVFESLNLLLKKFPTYFDDSLLKGYFRLQASCSNEFFEARSVRHLIRLICSHYFIYRELARSLRLFPEERHLRLRLMQLCLQFPFGTKYALGLAVGICPLSRYELFDEKHVLMAVQQCMPSVTDVPGSFYLSQHPQDHIRLLYIELEKNDGLRFSLNEVRDLKYALANSLKVRVEKLLPSLFMARNEEEILKTIFILRQEIQYCHSQPQVAISFESQSTTELFFTVVIVHRVKSPEQSFRKIAIEADGCCWTTSRIQVVEYLKDKSMKEAAVFHVKMQKSEGLLRVDFSVNFYLARQKLVETLQRILGPIRDYNGGLIVEQSKRFSEFKQKFSKEISLFPELAENFFYSLEPIEAQATIAQEHLERLFRQCLEAVATPLQKKESYFFKVEADEIHTFVTVCMRDATMKECFLKSAAVFGADKTELITTALTFYGYYIFGYIHTQSSTCSTKQFISRMQHAVAEGYEKVSGLRELRLAFPNFPVSLDPRIGGDSYSAMILKMLFEGLMKYGDNGALTYGICESVEFSADAKKYTFHLRKSLWSNGTPVTAHDFAYAWRKILDPEFYTPYVYLFYPIKGARQVKEGKLSAEFLGIHPIEDYTLVVELEHPAPYFLELTALSLYSPVPHVLKNVDSNWNQQVGQDYVCNGPFQLTKRNRTQGVLELKGNPLYWDPKPSQPDQVVIIQSNAQTALQMFKNDEIDWLGSPLQVWNPHIFKNLPDQVESIVSSGVFWAMFNVQCFPFQSIKLRQAFSCAIDRRKLVEELAYCGLPAFSPLPIMHTKKTDTVLADGDEAKALQLFEEALQELGITREELPVISFMHGIRDTFLSNVIQLVTGKWQQLFGIECRVERLQPWSLFFERMARGDFQVCFSCWETWVDDPIYTLNSFRYKEERINFTQWESTLFQTFLETADQTTETETRNKCFAKAEAILIQEVPVLPLLYDVHQFVKKEYVHIPNHKNTGKFNLRSASICKNFCPEKFKNGYL